MAHKTVFRVAKLTTYGNLAASGQHTWRERPTPNADADRTPLNEDWHDVHDADALLEAVRQRVLVADEMSRNHRPVLCLEYLITANAKAFQENGGHIDASAYFRDSLKWLEAKHGKDNIVAVNIQNDEEAPHMVVYAVPLVQEAAKTRKRSVIVGTNPDGTKRRETREFAQAATCRLSAAHFVDGPSKLSKLQTEFAEKVGKHHGLERGIEGSRAKRTTTKEYYDRVNEAFSELPKVTTPAPKLRPEPEKPGLFAGAAAKEAYHVDHAKWERERDAAERQWQQRQAEIKAQKDAAVETARRHEAQAAEAAALQRQVDELKTSNSHYVRKSAKLEVALAAAERVAKLFTPEEIRAAEERQRQEEAEKARLAGLARQEAEKARRAAEIEADRENRVRELTAPPRPLYGAASTLAKRAREAITAAGGDWHQVDWGQVTGAAAAEAIRDHGQEPGKVAADMLRLSPLLADPAEQHRWQTWLDKHARQFQDEYREAQRNRPRNNTPRAR